MKGFGVRVYPNGGKRYIAQTTRNGKTTRVQIGRHGVLPFDEVQKRARKIIADIDDGKNPNKDKKNERRSPTIKQLTERFLEEYVPFHCKPRTQVEYKHAINAYILAAFGDTKVAKLDRNDVADLHHSMRDTPYQANRTLGVLSKMLNQAEAWGYRPDRSNPCFHVKKYKEKKRERFLSPDELASLGEALDAEECFAPSAVTAFRLLIYTGARLSEIQTLKWDYIRGNKILLPDSKTGAKTIPLNQPALDILSEAERIKGNPYVVIGTQKGAFLTDLQKPWRRIRKQATVLYWLRHSETAARLVRDLTDINGENPSWNACQKAAETDDFTLPVGLTDVRIHDLRHTFASEAVMTGESLHMVGKILGHTQPQTTARYAHMADDPLQSASERIALSLQAAMAGKEQDMRESN